MKAQNVLGFRTRLLVLAVVIVFLGLSPLETKADEWIAFVSERGGAPYQGAEIYVMNPDGTGQTRLTFNDSEDSIPRLSPDASKIAFRSQRNNVWDIYVINVDGTGEIRLPGGELYGQYQLDWSPDCAKIAFTAHLGDSNIYIMNADGSNHEQVTDTPSADWVGSWSFNGEKIAFASYLDGNPADIYIMNIDGSERTRLTDSPGNDADPAWSPDGTKIAFHSDREAAAYDIYVMNADGSGQTNVSNSPHHAYQAAWSPDGTKILYSGIWETDWDVDREIIIMNADGTGQMNLTNSPGPDYGPDWVSGYPGQRTPAVAHAGPDQFAECVSPGGAEVVLDGSASTYPSWDTPTFEWSEGEIVLGYGEILPWTFDHGDHSGAATHVVTLTITLTSGASDTDEVVVTVQDTTPPQVTARLDNAPGSGASYEVVAQASDVCDPAPAIESYIRTDVVDGDIIKLVETDQNGVLRFASARFTLVVTAADASGNTHTETATASAGSSSP